MNGFIVLWRKFTQWEWYGDPKMVSLFIHLLLSANHAPQEWKGIKINRGQLVVGRDKLGKQVGLSAQNIRTCLSRLKSTNEITTKTTNKYSIITIINYDKYQSFPEKSTNNLTTESINNQPTTNHKQQYNKVNNYNIGKNKFERVLHDGTKAVNKFGVWYDANNPNVKIDENYYPEIK